MRRGTFWKRVWLIGLFVFSDAFANGVEGSSGTLTPEQGAKTMLASRLVKTLTVGPDVDKEALGVMKRFKDKRTRGIESVFAFDADFAGQRFRLFPGA